MTQPPPEGPHSGKPGRDLPGTSISSYGELYAPAAGGEDGTLTMNRLQENAPTEILRSGGRRVGPRAGRRQRRGRTGRRDWLWAAIPAVAGVAVGLAWWLLAPGGGNLISRDPAYATGENPAVWLPRDLTLAGLFLLAGCLTAVLLDGKSAEVHAFRRFVLAFLGASAGAVVAWQAGILAGQWWGSPVDTSPDPGIAFSLRALTVLLMWPGSLALSAFILSALAPDQGAEPPPKRHGRIRSRRRVK